MTDEQFTDEPIDDEEIEDFGGIEEASDLVIGFAWHDDGGHWHPAAFSYPDTFTDEQIDQLESLSNYFAERLTGAGLLLPTETA